MVLAIAYVIAALQVAGYVAVLTWLSTHKSVTTAGADMNFMVVYLLTGGMLYTVLVAGAAGKYGGTGMFLPVYAALTFFFLIAELVASYISVGAPVMVLPKLLRLY